MSIASLADRHPGRVILTVALRHAVEVHGPLGARRVLAQGAPLHVSAAQALAVSVKALVQTPFLSSDLRFGVAMILGFDPDASPTDAEDQIDCWLDENAALIVDADPISQPQTLGLLDGLRDAWLERPLEPDP